MPRDQGCREHIQRKLLVHILDKIPKPCKKELGTLGEDTSKQSQGAPEFVRREESEKSWMNFAGHKSWSREKGLKAWGTRDFHPCLGWAEPIPYSLSPCQSQLPWDSELPKTLNLCLLCT